MTKLFTNSQIFNYPARVESDGMKVTKYPQSCLVLCKDGQCILIDPGTLVTSRYKLADLGLVEAVLYTHQHPDHFDPSILEELRRSNIEIYCNSDVADQIGGGATVINDKDEFVVAGFKIKAYDIPHFKLPPNIKPVPNTGYVIDGHFFHPGDGVELEDLKVDDVALTIGGYGDDFLDRAAKFADSLEAKRIIPIHFEGLFKPDPQDFVAKVEGDRVIILKDGESVDL